MKNAFRKLIPALIMVIVSALFVGTSTYAWFSMNKKVTVTGMSVKTHVSDSLAIAAENHTDGIVDRQYQNYLDQTRAGTLRPVSTVDGVNFWYTNPLNVLGNGDAIDEEYVRYSEAGVESGTNPVDNNETNDANYIDHEDAAGKTHYDAAFQTAFEVETPIDPNNVIYGYMDYTFYIKTTNAANDAQDLVLEYCNILYNGSILGVDKAWRIAVFAYPATRNINYVADWTTDDVKALLKVEGATNFDGNKAVDGADSLGTVAYQADSDWSIDTIARTSTQYTKVTVRLWLEGEDTTCNNETFVKLTEEYTLDLAFSLGGTSVTYINSQLIAATEGTTNTNTITVTLDEQGRISNGQIPTGYQWKKANGTNATGEGATSQTYTIPSDADQKYYCEVTTAQGTYKTASYLYNPATTKTGTNYVTVALTAGKLDNGQTPATYKWYKDGGVETLYATSDFVITDSSDNGSYYCVITVGTGENAVTYQTKKINLTFTAPTITPNAYNTSATVSLHNNEPSATYQWYDDTDTAVDGATSATFAITSQSDNGYYYCKVTARGTYNTLSVMLNCTPAVRGEGTDTATVTVIAGKLTNGETPTAYQWYDDTDAAVDGATTNTFTATADGAYYCVITTAAAGNYTTDKVNLTVTP